MADAPIAAPVAPPPQAPSVPSAPPVQTQVRIDQNPGNIPAPVGSQAPPKPPKAPETPSVRAQSRREVIAKNFAKAQEKGRPGPAEAKIGHNQPPEAMKAEAQPPAKREAQQPPMIDLRRPPPKEKRNQQQRGEHGHFASASSGQVGQAPGQTGQVRQAPGAQAPSPQQGVQPLPVNAPYREAPTRMHERARQEWARTPESVRGEVHRLHREFAGAYQQLKASHDAFTPLRPYHELARAQGTTLERALSNYVSMEDTLRQNPLQGLETLIRNMNLRTADGHQLTLYDVAYYVATQTPQELQSRQNQHIQSAHQQQIQQLQQYNAQLADQVQRMQYAQEYAQQYFHTRRAVDRFAETHPRLDELGDVIAAEMPASNYDIEVAYRRAELLHPATHAAQTRALPAPAAQTRAVIPDRSISGAPAGGTATGNSHSARRPGKPPPNRRDIIANAVRRVNGAL